MREKVLKVFLLFFSFIDNLNHKIFFNRIKKIPKISPLSLLDIGSSYDIQPRWKKIKRLLKYHGFEPNIELQKELRDKNKDCVSYNIYPYLITDEKGKKKLKICKDPGVSSLLEPNMEFLSKFRDKERFKIVEEPELEANFLDDLNLNDIDFIKIDIQGAELKALMGAKETLSNAIGLEIEVEFQKMYQNQPLFGEINNFVCSQNFEFIDFPIIKRWERKNNNSYGQAIFADALFLRTPEYANKNFDINKMIKYILILILYNKFDLIWECNLDKFFSNNEINQIKKITKFFEKKNNITRFITSISTGFTKLLGSEYKSHLFH